MIRTMILAGCAALLLCGQASAQQQYYGKWKKSSDGRYYCDYYYKARPADAAYKKQYVIYSPKDPHWVYWANPKDNPDNAKGADSYWARCPTKYHPTYGQQIKAGKDIWCILPADKRPAEFAKLNAADFPEPKVMSPPIPGAPNGGGTIACPPDVEPALDPADLPK
jgi:hypothetical protein